MKFSHPGTRVAALPILLVAVLFCSPALSQSGWGVWATPDASCSEAQAWYGQQNIQSEPTGMRNVAYPEGNATYWAGLVSGTIGSTVTIKGQFPAARYMGIQVYDIEHNVRGAIGDQEINPDAGTNNPFRSGSTAELGTYTVKLVFGATPATPAPNTIYSDGLTEVGLVYRVYYPNNVKSLYGSTTSPKLPKIKQNGVALSTCKPRPILPKSETVNGHIDQYDFTGTIPVETRPVTNPPSVLLSITNPFTPFYPSADNNYMSALISRQFMTAPYDYNMVVMRFRAPTFPNTQTGEAPWLATTERQVRFWSVCENEPLTTGVTRCLADGQSHPVDGFVTVVFSDPSNKPSNSQLQTWGASWLPFGALLDTDVVYTLDGEPKTNADGIYWYGFILYRQTLANPSWTQSMSAVGQLPRTQVKAAMGDYYPKIGYCRKSDFKKLGAGCIGL